MSNIWQTIEDFEIALMPLQSDLSTILTGAHKCLSSLRAVVETVELEMEKIGRQSSTIEANGKSLELVFHSSKRDVATD